MIARGETTLGQRTRISGVDLAIDFATLGEYGLEPLPAEARAAAGRGGRLRPPAGWEALATARRGACAPRASSRPRPRLANAATGASRAHALRRLRRADARHASRGTNEEPPEGGSQKKNRRRPTLPGGCPPSTIGAEGLNGSVRNGKRCFPLAMTTEICRDRPPRRGLKTARRPKKDKNRQDLDPLVPVC